MITAYIIYFFVLSAAGYVYETIAMTIWGGKWDNRGFFYGPLIPIYGAGALGGTLLFTYFIFVTTAFALRKLPFNAIKKVSASVREADTFLGIV